MALRGHFWRVCPSSRHRPQRRALLPPAVDTSPPARLAPAPFPDPQLDFDAPPDPHAELELRARCVKNWIKLNEEAL